MTPDNNPLLGVVLPPDTAPPERAAEAVREAAEWVTDELGRLRRQRKQRDVDGAAEIAALRRALIDDRQAINARVKVLAAEQTRLARVLRILDR